MLPPRLIIPCFAAVAAILFCAPQAARAAPSTRSGKLDAAHVPSMLYPRQNHDHHHGHAEPLILLNESQVLQGHAPTPPSYWSLDVDGVDPGHTPHTSLMVLHVAFMCFAFFVVLPAGIALRSMKHPWHGVFTVVFWTSIAVGLAANSSYRKLTPNMYESEAHSFHGYLILGLAAILSVIDGLAVLQRLYHFVQALRHDRRNATFYKFWDSVVLNRDVKDSGSASDIEYQQLLLNDLGNQSTSQHKLFKGESVIGDEEAEEADATSEWVNNTRPPLHKHQSVSSFDHGRHSEETLQDPTTPIKSSFAVRVQSPLKTSSLLTRLGVGTLAILERFLVFAAFSAVLEGIAVYTGGCRQNYLNGCLAHLIKGSIFWCYGLVSFARYIGAFSSLGWAWNKSPHGERYPSAEFVECLVIFLYGASNTWMERFGAQPGDPYTTKEIQHISIAVMFWFAGLLGMGLESKSMRRWLATGSVSPSSHEDKSSLAVSEPPSYRASFNPFPALVIGVTGAAMSAHAQAYVFQVQIHALWGNFLVAFAVLRCITYFFLWLSPPRSILPSRPPTEALGSFFLACGGLSFMFSTEEVTFAAMRRGRDDVMMFLNVTVAITCLAFCWTLLVVTFKAWLRSRVFNVTALHTSD